jgi:heme o synthase
LNPASKYNHAPARTAPRILNLSTVTVESKVGANWFRDLLALTKARVNIFVVATAFVGFTLNAGILQNWLLLLHTLIGTGLVAGGAAVANQALEQQFDRNMIRTRNRPLAAGRLPRRTAVIFSSALLGAGCLWLGIAVNSRAMSLAFLTFLIYAFAYTPLKRRTPTCTLVGAIAGALPILVGWAATGADFDIWTAVAFGILLLWQIPHFLAIAWWRKADYSRAGFHVLRHEDNQGYQAAGWALACTVAMIGVSLVPFFTHRVGVWYFLTGLALGAGILLRSIQFLVRRNEVAARSLFIASLLYLPCLYFLMLLSRHTI